MARYDRDSTPRMTNDPQHLDKLKGQMSVREAASMEMPEQHIGMERRGTTVHGFGDGQTGMPMHGQRTVSESVVELIEQVFQLPFHAQLSMMRMMAPRILGVMDARDQETFLNDLRRELESMMSGEQTETPIRGEQDIQDT
ncbi:MAG TPA: hypothetical protein VF794_04625 [Archangium sp.]